MEASKISHKKLPSVHLSNCIAPYAKVYFSLLECISHIVKVYFFYCSVARWSVFIDSSGKEEARTMWLLLTLCHFSILERASN